jgi:hypothetical protein
VADTNAVMAVLNIDIEKTTEGVNSQFNAVYPFLRIGFFQEPHAFGKSNGKSKIINGSMKIGQLKRSIEPGTIEINGSTTVWELESSFEKKFGLHIQVFRKSGSIWLETTATDNWTLEQQNEQGKFLDEDLKFEKENSDEHDIY